MKLNWKLNWKKLAIGGAVAAALAIGGSVWYYVGHNSADPIYVYQFDFIGMTEYWGDSRESYGPVSTDRIQTVFLSDTQTVNEVLVAEGDSVKKGDLLMTFDTTLSALAVEKKRLEVERAKLQLEDAEARLMEINNMRPMQEGDPNIPYDPGDDIKLVTSYELFPSLSPYPRTYDYDGSSANMAIICWMQPGTVVTNNLLNAAAQRALELQQANIQNGQSQASDFPENEEIPENNEVIPENEGAPENEENPENEGEQNEPENDPELPDSNEPEDDEPSGPVIPDDPELPEILNDFYVVFKSTSDNYSRGSKTVWQGMHIYRAGGHYNFSFCDSAIEDYSMKPVEDDDGPSFDFGSGLTAAQISQLRNEQQKKIKELQLKLKMTDAEYKIMQSELSDGNIYAETDGKVISVLTEDEAKMNQQPVLKVSGGGGFVVEGSLSELERDTVAVGQEVTIQDWQSGMTYTGTITEIRDFPTGQQSYYGAGNPNASRYPFTAFVDDSADLRAGSYVSIQYSASDSENGLYVQKPFVRTEQGISYVLVLGENGRLEKRIVSTGKSLWGSYIEVTSGMTADDQIAFPYGKNVKPGAKAVPGDLSNLYDY